MTGTGSFFFGVCVLRWVSKFVRVLVIKFAQ